jgi:hypothetical protein
VKFGIDIIHLDRGVGGDKDCVLWSLQIFLEKPDGSQLISRHSSISAYASERFLQYQCRQQSTTFYRNENLLSGIFYAVNILDII